MHLRKLVGITEPYKKSAGVAYVLALRDEEELEVFKVPKKATGAAEMAAAISPPERARTRRGGGTLRERRLGVIRIKTLMRFYHLW